MKTEYLKGAMLALKGWNALNEGSLECSWEQYQLVLQPIYMLKHNTNYCTQCSLNTDSVSVSFLRESAPLAKTQPVKLGYVESENSGATSQGMRPSRKIVCVQWSQQWLWPSIISSLSPQCQSWTYPFPTSSSVTFANTHMCWHTLRVQCMHEHMHVCVHAKP